MSISNPQPVKVPAENKFQPTKIPYHFPAHFWRHCLSFLMSAAFTCATELILLEYIRPAFARSPVSTTNQVPAQIIQAQSVSVQVRWQQDGSVTMFDKNLATNPPPVNSTVRIGFGADGRVYWEAVKP